MRRMFWLGFGIAAGIAVSRRISGAAHSLTPEGAAENIGGALRELAAAMGSFSADVRAGMAEREAELHATLAARTGIDTAPRHLASGRAAWTPPAPTADGPGSRRQVGGPAGT